MRTVGLIEEEKETKKENIVEEVDKKEIKKTKKETSIK